ncbi:MAG TPA: DUF4350 domain-containing protein [Puia sp.]|nr:DUF4350 domain-containing protein [Puia sp.]
MNGNRKMPLNDMFPAGWFRWALTGLMAVLLLGSCSMGGRKRLDRRISLNRKDDIPYGTQVAYEALPHIFPGADIVTSTNKHPFSMATATGSGKAFIVIGTSVEADAADITTLMNFIGQGNQVFISASTISGSLLANLSIRATAYTGRSEEPDSLTVGVYNPANDGYRTFSYPGDSYDNWVTKLDTQYTSVLGRDGHGRPDFVRLTYKGGGAIYLHFAPLAFSNFFLLHKQNMAYYETALSYMPSTTRTVIWDEFYRYNHSMARGNGKSAFSALGYILSVPSLRLAFWLSLLLMGILYLFESKRRQRQIPVIGPLQNTSLDFVRTIGRLYYQRRDNHNLATKMTVHFQDYVRTRHHLASTAMDEAFVDRLAYRTGYPKQELAPLVEYMQQLPSKAYISDEELLDFHRQLEAFYKQT